MSERKHYGAIRNLDGQVKGHSSPTYSFRVDSETHNILIMIQRWNMNNSEFIRKAIRHYYQTVILPNFLALNFRELLYPQEEL